MFNLLGTIVVVISWREVSDPEFIESETQRAKWLTLFGVHTVTPCVLEGTR